MYDKTLIQRQKGYFYNSEKFRSFGVKWARMGGKIKTYEGCFAKR
jgi:hypothetical protein